MSDAAAGRVCDVFCSARRDGAYMYVDQAEGFSRVPQPLLDGFGEARFVLTVTLHPGRRLARADAAAVLAAIDEQGFYLQLPPGHPVRDMATGIDSPPGEGTC